MRALCSIAASGTCTTCAVSICEECEQSGEHPLSHNLIKIAKTTPPISMPSTDNTDDEFSLYSARTRHWFWDAQENVNTNYLRLSDECQEHSLYGQGSIRLYRSICRRELQKNLVLMLLLTKILQAAETLWSQRSNGKKLEIYRFIVSIIGWGRPIQIGDQCPNWRDHFIFSTKTFEIHLDVLLSRFPYLPTVIFAGSYSWPPWVSESSHESVCKRLRHDSSIYFCVYSWSPRNWWVEGRLNQHWSVSA